MSCKSNLIAFLGTIALLVCLPALGVASSLTRDEKAAIQFIFATDEETNRGFFFYAPDEDLSQEERKQEDLYYKQDKEVASFLYRKAEEYAKTNKDFANEVELQDLKEDLSLSLITLDNDHVLVNVRTSTKAYNVQASTKVYNSGYGFMFLIDRNNPDWVPLRLEQWRDGKLINSYRTGDVEGISPASFSVFNYPKNSERDFDDKGILDTYIIKAGKFKLIKASETVPWGRLMEYNFRTELKQLIKEGKISGKVVYIGPHIELTYKTFAPKGKKDLTNVLNWKPMYVVRASKSHFYNDTYEFLKTHDFLTRGDVVYVTKLKYKWAEAHFLDPQTNQPTSGWVKLDDLETLDQGGGLENDEG